MLLHTSFKLNSVIAVKIKHTLHCLYIELYEESVVFGVVVFKASMLNWGGRSARWSAYMSSNGKHLKLPFRSTARCMGDRSARKSAKISFNNSITYYTWQIWALIVEICNCHVGVFWGCQGCQGGLHLIWLYNDNWMFTTLIIQK